MRKFVELSFSLCRPSDVIFKIGTIVPIRFWREIIFRSHQLTQVDNDNTSKMKSKMMKRSDTMAENKDTTASTTAGMACTSSCGEEEDFLALPWKWAQLSEFPLGCPIQVAAHSNDSILPRTRQ